MKEVKKKESVFAKKGVFITLVGLAAVIVIALTMNMTIRKEEESRFDETAWEDAVEKVTETSDGIYQEEAQAVNAPAVPEKEEEPVQQEETAEETASQPPEPAPEERKSILMEKPVTGGIVKDFSAEELVYSDTMQDWRVHEGIDFSAEEKTEVKAAADGTIESVSRDGLYGACLVISHPDGIRTFYGNLEEDSLPTAGIQVKAGQTIGKVGKTATVEINDAPHLHFEVQKDGKPVNPHDYLGDTVADDE